MTARQLDQVISACYSADAEIWKVAAPRIIKFINAARYVVIVPDHEVALFKSISPAEYEVAPETHYVPDWQGLLAKHNPPLRGKSYGWYLQQFIKLAAVAAAPPNSIILIWDADTVPQKTLNFIDGQGRLIYYTSTENYAPYFATIAKILSLEKIVAFSFIAQCFPVKQQWCNEFCAELTQRFRKPWMEAIMSNLDLRMGLCFSEYETLGTFISHRHSTEITFTNRPWQRDGALMTASRSQIEFDFISYERSQRIGKTFSGRLAKKIRRIYKSIRRKFYR